MNGIGTILDLTNFGLSTLEEATISDVLSGNPG